MIDIKNFKSQKRKKQRKERKPLPEAAFKSLYLQIIASGFRKCTMEDATGLTACLVGRLKTMPYWFQGWLPCIVK